MTDRVRAAMAIVRVVITITAPDRARAVTAIAAVRADRARAVTIAAVRVDRARAVTIAAVRADRARAVTIVAARADITARVDRARAVTAIAAARADITAREARVVTAIAAVRADITARERKAVRAVTVIAAARVDITIVMVRARAVMVIAAVRVDIITVVVRAVRVRAAMVIVAVRAADTITVAVKVRAADSQEDLPLEQTAHVAVRTDRDVRQGVILQIRRSKMLKSTEMKKREESVRKKTNAPEKTWFMKRMNPRCPEVSASEDLSDLRSEKWKNRLNRSR